MRWLVVDSLYCPEAWFCSHLDSYTYYLNQHTEDASPTCLNIKHPHPSCPPSRYAGDVAFVLDGYGDPPTAKVHIAQVAAICNPMPWDVRNADGSPAYDLILSSLQWMVEEARVRGCRAEYMPLAFDTRARVCGMGVKRDLKCSFIGTLGPNHKRRTEIVEVGKAEGWLTVFPPTFGRDYFRILARSQSVLNVHAEWARGELNNMRTYEAAGMGAFVTGYVEGDPLQMEQSECLTNHTYESRIPRLVELAHEIMETKR